MSRAIRSSAVDATLTNRSATDRNKSQPQTRSIKRKLRNSSLSVVLAALFLIFLVGQSVTGLRFYNQQQQEHGQETVTYARYLVSGHFLESVGENWESEFLQMAMFAFLTVFLYQKGSAESNDPDNEEPPRPKRPDSPWAVRVGGWVETIYNHSLSIALFTLFIISFLIHLFAGAKEYQQDQLEHGESMPTMIEYLGTSRFWFESFQNWQSEFLAILAMVVLTIWLREKGSPESKDPATPHWEHD
jgi:hypothetical protein